VISHLENSTVADLLDRAAKAGGNRTGIWWGDRLIDYAALAEDSRKMAAGLLKQGLSKGDHVSIWSPNCPDFLTTFFACARIGVATALINTRLTAIEAADIIRRSDSRALLYFGEPGNDTYRDKVAAIDKALVADLKLVVELEGDGRGEAGGVMAASQLRNSGSLGDNLADAGDSALLYSTSGSTGPSKLVLHTNETLATHAVDAANMMGFEEAGAVLLIPLPLAGAYGTTQLLAAIAATIPIVLMDQFDPHRAAAAIRTHGVTHINTFDEIIIKLMEVTTEDRPFPTLRSCAYARFNPSYPNFIEECERRGFPIRGLYGTSEIQGFYSMQYADASVERRQVAGGWPAAKNGAFRIRDMETGELLPPGKTGEIEVFGPSRMICYYGNPEATRSQIMDDGFYKTGDTGHIAQDGSLVFEARLNEVMRLSGYMVSVVEIESFVESLPGVDRCQVVGIRADGGNRPFAFVKMKPGAAFDEAAARQACEKHLAKFKIPVAFHLIDVFPMGVSVNAPKIDKRSLTAQAADIIAAAHDA
jgi:fatty-acyl-CoA synthase